MGWIFIGEDSLLGVFKGSVSSEFRGFFPVIYSDYKLLYLLFRALDGPSLFCWSRILSSVPFLFLFVLD